MECAKALTTYFVIDESIHLTLHVLVVYTHVTMQSKKHACIWLSTNTLNLKIRQINQKLAVKSRTH